MSALVYIGDGSFLPGVPARDLTEEEVVEYGPEKLLISSGLYEKPKSGKKETEKEGE